MKFLALLKKELRESLLPIALVTLVVSGLTMLMLRAHLVYGWDNYRYYESRDWYSHAYSLFHRYPLGELGGLLLCASAFLGLTLGALHFGLPALTRTWAFLLHRPVSWIAILGSKFLASLIAFGVCLGIPWSWTYPQVYQINATGFPPNEQVFWEGWLFIGLGLLLYLGIALCAVTNAKWYTTRFVGPVFAVIWSLAVCNLTSVVVAFTWLMAGMAVLLTLVVTTFFNRESSV